ncbi:MAG TPA: VanZ family protein [Chitinophagaceae bacterium]|nr:VanZ family protein [Chitinophagaceae bacterium]
MFLLLRKIGRKIYVPLAWTVFTQLLLSIPGSLFRGSGFLRIPHADKIAHLVLFGGLMLFWGLYFIHRHGGLQQRVLWTIFFIISLYGVGVEFFQVNFIPNRSFDIGDIVADVCGAFCGYLATLVVAKKN